MIYRGMDQQTLDAAYHTINHVGMADLRSRVADWTQRSAKIAATHKLAELTYGDRPRQRIDFFEAEPGGPFAGDTALAFIHGGYWQSQDKETYRFIGEGALARGMNFANIEYTLAPEQTIGGIVDEIKCAIARLNEHLGGRGALHLAGHSAGGHLAAMTITEPGVKSALSISGLFDLEPVRLTFLNEKLLLSADQAEQCSPILHMPQFAPPLLISYGQNELPEFHRQSQEFHASWRANGLNSILLPVAGTHHFSVLEELARRDGVILNEYCRLIASM